MTPGTNRRGAIFGAVDVASGCFLYQVCRKAVSASFTAFLERLLAADPAAPQVAVVCDNVIIHDSKIVQRWLGHPPSSGRVARGALQPARQPGRAGLGSAEGMAGQHPDADDPRPLRQVHAFFRARGPTELLATAAPHSSPWLPEGYVQNLRRAA
jgi:hypothetical protein